MTDSTKEILYGDSVIAAIRYAYDRAVTMEYVVRTQDSTIYTDLLEILTVTPIDQLDVDDISRRLVVSPNNRTDVGLRILFAHILNTVPLDDPNTNVTESIRNAYNQYADTLGIEGLNAERYSSVFTEQLSNYQSPDVENIFERIDNTVGILLRGYQNEWRQRLLGSDEPNPDEIQDYERKFGQPYTEPIDSNGEGFYSTVDRLPVSSAPKYSRVIYTAVATMDDQTGLNGDMLDGYALFNLTQVSEDMPLVLYTRDDREKYYKVLDGFNVTDSINAMFIRPFENAAAVLQRGPLIVEKSGGRGKVRIRQEVTSEYNDANTIQYIYRYGNNYINIILYLETRTVNINIYSGELEGIDRIGDISIAGLTPTNIDGKFDIYGDHMPPFVVEDVMTTNVLLSRMFDILEASDISASHMTPSYVYRFPNIEDVEQLNMNRAPPSIRFSIENSYVTGPEFDSDGVQIPVGTAKTTIHFNPIERLADLDRFVVFMRLFAVYISNIQYELFDEYYAVTGVSYPEYTRVSTLETRSILKARRPDIFIDGYATICQSDRQPQIITEDEYNDMTKAEKNRTLLFPKAPLGEVDDQIILYCSDRKVPYPTLRRNTLSNSSQFPVLPCCQANNTQGRRNTIDYYNLTGQYTKSKDSTRDDIIILRTLQILQPGAASEVLRTNIPSLYNALGYTGGTAVKVGVVQDNDSFIRACAYLLDDPELTRQTVLDDEWNSALVAQECYDDPNPRQTLQNTDTVFDDRYYRIIEVMYDITIYVMYHNNNNIEFKLPRHISPYIRNYRNNTCILILETVEQGIPRYEPLLYRVISTDDMGREVANDFSILTPENNSTIFHDYYMRTVGTMNADRPYIPLNLSTEGAVGQLIDRDGKMRGISYSNVSIITEPSQPLDLPSITIDRMTAADSLQSIRDLFPNNDIEFSSRYSGIGLNGVWYTVEGIDCFSIVTDAVRELTDIPISTRSIPYIDVSSDYNWYDFIYSYETQRATLNVILDFIYHVYYYNGQSDTLFYVDDSADSLDDYIIDRIPHDLNVQLTLEQAAALSNIVRLIDGQYRIYLYSRQFADGVLYHVNRLLKTNVIPVTTLAIPPLNYTENSNIYRGDVQYTTWLDLNSYGVSQYEYVPYNYTNIYPYIYTKGSMYFIIQPINTKDAQGEIKATYVAALWRKTRINYGYNPTVDNINEIEVVAPTEIVNGQIVNIYADFFYHENRIYAILPFEDLDETVVLENRRAEEYRVWQGQGTTESTTRVIGKRGGRGRGRTDTTTGARGGTVILGRRGRGRPPGTRGRGRTTTREAPSS